MGKKQNMTRICKIKDFHGFIGGKDNDNVFDEGVIYECKKVFGEIILTPIGEHQKFNKQGEKISMLSLEENIIGGDYLMVKDDYDD